MSLFYYDRGSRRDRSCFSAAPLYLSSGGWIPAGRCTAPAYCRSLESDIASFKVITFKVRGSMAWSVTNAQAQKLDAIIPESMACCFSDETKLIAPRHPSWFPPTFAETALRGHELHSSKCVYISTWLTTAFKTLHHTVTPVEPLWTYSYRPYPTSILGKPALLPFSTHLYVPTPAFLGYSCSAARGWY